MLLLVETQPTLGVVGMKDPPLNFSNFLFMSSFFRLVGLSRGFMGRARVGNTGNRDSGSMSFKNAFIPEIVSEFLQPFKHFGTRRGYPFVCETIFHDF